MLGIEGAEHCSGDVLHLLVAHLLDGLHIHHREHRIALHIGIAQGDAEPGGSTSWSSVRLRSARARTGRLRAQIVGDGQGVGEAHVAAQRD
jgi:hypothetical protein